MSNGLYKIGGVRDKNECQGFESFLHTLTCHALIEFKIACTIQQKMRF